MVEHGDPRDVICEVAERLKVDFLVVGSHGYGVIKRLIPFSSTPYTLDLTLFFSFKINFYLIFNILINKLLFYELSTDLIYLNNLEVHF